MSSYVKSSRRVLRSRGWLGFGWVLGAVALLTAVAVIQSGGGLGSSLLVAVVMGLPGLWVVARVPFMKVTLDPDCLSYVGMFRRRRFARQEVTSVAVEAVQGGDIFDAYAPVLRTGESEFALMHLAGYSTTRRLPAWRMARQTGVIADWLQSA